MLEKQLHYSFGWLICSLLFSSVSAMQEAEAGKEDPDINYEVEEPRCTKSILRQRPEGRASKQVMFCPDVTDGRPPGVKIVLKRKNLHEKYLASKVKREQKVAEIKKLLDARLNKGGFVGTPPDQEYLEEIDEKCIDLVGKGILDESKCPQIINSGSNLVFIPPNGALDRPFRSAVDEDDSTEWKNLILREKMQEEAEKKAEELLSGHSVFDIPIKHNCQIMKESKLDLLTPYKQYGFWGVIDALDVNSYKKNLYKLLIFDAERERGKIVRWIVLESRLPEKEKQALLAQVPTVECVLKDCVGNHNLLRNYALYWVQLHTFRK